MPEIGKCFGQSEGDVLSTGSLTNTWQHSRLPPGFSAPKSVEKAEQLEK